MDSDQTPIQLPAIPPDANKYSRGSLLICAGSARYPGAAILAAQAAARAGAGYVTLAMPASQVPVAISHLLAVPVLAAKEQDGCFASDALPGLLSELRRLDAILVGPGLTANDNPQAFLASLLRQATTPLILDADALNLLAWPDPVSISQPLWRILPPNCILTPHAGELARLLNSTATGSANELASLLQAIIVAKGPETTIYPADSQYQPYLYVDGTPALAKAGTGDVLAGIIASLRVQGADPWQAAVTGVRLHGRAGRLSEMNGSRRSLLASDIIDWLPQVFREIEGI